VEEERRRDKRSRGEEKRSRGEEGPGGVERRREQKAISITVKMMQSWILCLIIKH